MIRASICIAALLAAPVAAQQEPKPQPQHPPYRVTVTAKTKFAKWKDGYKDFEERLRKMLPGAKYLGTRGVADDKAGWELWEFEIAWDAKFDQAKFTKLFGEMKIGKIELATSGEVAVDMKSKTITLTAFGEKIKMKLLNRPKKDFNDVPENKLAKLVETVNAGKKFFRISGEVMSSGDIWAIYLDDFAPLPEPRK